jgi:hypothetical protein
MSLKKTEFVYADNWRLTCRRTYQLLPRCVCNPLHKAVNIHHLKYKRSIPRRLLGMLLLHPPRKSVSGFEIPGWDCVPVCEKCHENYYGRTVARHSVHCVDVWIQRGGLDNHNIWWFAWKLRIKFWIWALLFQLGRLAFFAVVK